MKKLKRELKPRFPIYIPSYSRYQWSRALTARSLMEMGLDFTFIVEPEQEEEYITVFGKRRVKVLPEEYHLNYETLDELGMTKSQGPGPARNFAWDDSIKRGYTWHWVMDDNIANFYIFNKNLRLKTTNPAFFRLMEEFTLLFDNVSMAGPHYLMFVPDIQKRPPFIINTRIYSCNLIRNDTPYRWRGRYNEDTILSLDMLTDGWVTIQFNHFLQEKINTQKILGGNNERIYSQEGTYPKSAMLQRAYPLFAKVVWKFGRWHHYVDYSGFKQKPKLKEGVVLPKKPPFTYHEIHKKSGLLVNLEYPKLKDLVL